MQQLAHDTTPTALLATLLVAALAAPAQEALHIDGFCGYHPTETAPQRIYVFPADDEALAAVMQLLRHVGLEPNFVLVAADVDNAAAAMVGDERYILYNQQFMDRVRGTTGTDWAAISILAHELGHHLQGHTLYSEGEAHEKELEADQFSGFILARMGATAEQAQAALRTIASESGSDSHPPKSARLAAIYNGWRQARMLDEAPAPASSPHEEPTGAEAFALLLSDFLTTNDLSAPHHTLLLDAIADIVFHAKHPQLRGRKIRAHEKALAREWLAIRNGPTIVDFIFHMLHPELGGRKIAAHETELAATWREIQRRVERVGRR